MSTHVYQLKSATTFQEQLEKMKLRGLKVSDDDEAISILKRINYYRFTGYLLPFKQPTDSYEQGITFERIYKIYEFDQRLRNILMRQLENIEISIKTKIGYHLGHKYSANGYEDPINFRPLTDKEGNSLHENMLQQLKIEFHRSVRKGQLFAIHHLRKYGGNLPIWVAVELMSFGNLFTLYSIMKKEDQDAISRVYFHAKSDYVVSWLRTLRYIRNACAHYERLYDLDLDQPPQLHSRESSLFSNRKIFATLFVCCRLADSDSEREQFIGALEYIVDTYSPNLNMDHIGFPLKWNEILRNTHPTIKQNKSPTP